jgi:hypothetical protein
VRELEEELGVKVPLKKVCKFKCFSEIEREISVLYVCSFDGDVTFSDKEISRGVFMGIESVKKEVEFGKKKFALGFKKALREFCESTESKLV